MTNSRKLTDMFRDPFVPFEDEDEIYKLLTMELTSEKLSKYILEWGKIGQRMLVEYTTEHLIDRGVILCVGQNHKEEAQNIQNVKCHDKNECWRKACKERPKRSVDRWKDWSSSQEVDDSLNWRNAWTPMTIVGSWQSENTPSSWVLRK